MAVLAKVTVGILKLWTFCYELVTWPIYFIFQTNLNLIPISNVAESIDGKVLAKPVISNDPSAPWRNVKSMSQLSRSCVPGSETLDDLFMQAYQNNPDKKCLGTRKLLKSEMEIQSNGKQFKKLTLEKYYWETYSEVNDRIDNFGKGLIKLGQRSGVYRVLIFAETRAEWMIAAQSCFRYNLAVVTLYATLGEEAIVHGINESEATVVVTSEELLPKLSEIIKDCPHVKYLIFMNNAIFMKSDENQVKMGNQLILKYQEKLPQSILLHQMSDIELNGSTYKIEPNGDSKPTRDSLAMIMYTSGSTGIPKGVMMSHHNLMSAMAGQYEGLPPLDTIRDVYIGYLPLAHVLEFCCENVVLAFGIPVGYSSPLTLVSTSSKIKSGTKGDINMLRPTLMACVPTILERITKSVWEKAVDNGPLFHEMFTWAYNYKSRRMDHGYPSLFMDKFVFKKIKRLLGGKVRYMLSGGAPLSEEAQNFINICFCPIIQGYGLTESCGAGTVMVDRDRRVGQVGPPLNSVEIKLREWQEGGYSPEDLPKPRGEILIGGGVVCQGYFKQPEKTQEDFIIDENNQRWFCTGDIGVFHVDGSLSIIDRKKDLVKLQGGEYISLGKIELAVSSCPIVESSCAVADSTQDYVVLIVSAKKKQLLQLIEKTIPDLSLEYFSDLCTDKRVKTQLLNTIQKACRDKKLERMEIPVKLFIDEHPWTPDTGLVTDALKLKRRSIQERFQTQIDEMYNKVVSNNNNSLINGSVQHSK